MGIAEQIQNQIYDAVDVIVSNRIEQVKFNQTDTCKIIDAKMSNIGMYTVQMKNNLQSYTAYSDNHDYKVGQYVDILIPNGDYEGQKTIIGKHIDTAKEVYTTYTPFDKFVKITNNIMLPHVEVGLVANNIDEKEIQIFNNLNYQLTEDAQVIEYKRYYQNIAPEGEEAVYEFIDLADHVDEEIVDGTITIDDEEIELFDQLPSDDIYKGFTRLGLRANFKSLLGGSSVVKDGDYGLKLIISFMSEQTVDGEELREQDAVLYLSSKNAMYGDCYNYFDYFSQEALYEITKLNKILGIKVYFYQNNDFIKVNGDLLEYKDEQDEIVPKNLLVAANSIELYLGYDVDEFESNKAYLYTTDYPTYSPNVNNIENNTKTIKLRWAYKFDNTNIVVVDKDTKFDESIKVHIVWYRYKLGAPSADEDSGVYWEKIEELEDDEEPTGEYPVVVREGGYQCTLVPNIKQAQEKIKVIISLERPNENEGVYQLYEKIYSDVLIFENQEEVVNSVMSGYLEGLNLWCADNTYGNYFVYGQDQRVIKSSLAQEVRKMRAHFSEETYILNTENEGTLAVLTSAQTIKWTIPIQNTMIRIPGYKYGYSIEDQDLTALGCDSLEQASNAIVLVRNGDPDNDYEINNEQSYCIRDYYNQTDTNNTIKCEVLRENNITYVASKSLVFGTQGSSGTDTTLTLNYMNGATGAIIGLQDSFYVEAKLYDYANREVTDLSDLTYTWSFKNSLASSNISSLTITGSDKNRKMITYNFESLSAAPNEIPIIECTVSGWGDYDLTAYLPIAIHSEECGYLIGATTVIYPSSGEAFYYKDPYQLYDTTGQLMNLSSVTILNPNNREQAKYLPSISSTKVLKPIAIMIEGIQDIGVTLQSGTSYWYQPLIIMKNRYPSGTINKWNGKDIEINETEGYILSPAIAAGKKHNDNTFSGVMLGDWSQTNTASDISAQTGIYGFNHGAMCYAFKEDGTAFIGKSGKGRIVFDGNSGVIKSAMYDGDTSKTTGMLIDLDDGEIKAYGNFLLEGLKYDPITGDPSGIILSSSGTTEPYLRVLDTGTPVVEISSTNEYIQTKNYSSGTSGLKLDFKNGTFEANDNFLLKAINSSTNNGIILSSSGTSTNPYLRILDSNIPVIEISSSSEYIQTSNYSSGSTGLKLDFKNGTFEANDNFLLKAISNNKGIVLSSGDGNNPYLKIQNGSGINLLYFDSNNQYIQSTNYSQRTSVAGSGEGTKIDLSNGIITVSAVNNGTITIGGKSTQGNVQPLFSVSALTLANGQFAEVDLINFNSTYSESSGGGYTITNNFLIQGLNYVRTSQSQGMAINLVDDRIRFYDNGSLNYTLQHEGIIFNNNGPQIKSDGIHCNKLFIGDNQVIDSSKNIFCNSITVDLNNQYAFSSNGVLKCNTLTVVNGLHSTNNTFTGSSSFSSAPSCGDTRLATLDDIPSVSGYATQADLTALEARVTALEHPTT